MKKLKLHYPDLFNTMVNEINERGVIIPTTALGLMFDARELLLMKSGDKVFWGIWGGSMSLTTMFYEPTIISEKCTNVYEIRKESDMYSIKRIK